MKDLVIPKSILEELRQNKSELLLELAVYLYDKEQLTMGRAKKMAGLTQVEFQKELSKKGIFIKYDIEDFEADLETIKRLS